jgi:hypothetical protein
MREQLRRERFLARQQRSVQATYLLDLPETVLYQILSYCEPASRQAALAASR